MRYMGGKCLISNEIASIINPFTNENTNGTLEFLKCLYAEAKGLREADKIVYDKLKELAKEEENVAQEK